MGRCAGVPLWQEHLVQLHVALLLHTMSNCDQRRPGDLPLGQFLVGRPIGITQADTPALQTGPVTVGRRRHRSVFAFAVAARLRYTCL